jgi:hypothetical protein
MARKKGSKHYPLELKLMALGGPVLNRLPKILE